MTGKPHSKFRHVYAIVRIDPRVDAQNNFSVVKVLRSETKAKKETIRLNELNRAKECIYVMQTTRMVE
jgi:hypothetical protein